MKKLLIAIIIAGAFSSCSNYYQAITASEPAKAASYNNFPDNKKYYILRNGREAFAMKKISISNDQKNIQCTLEPLPVEHQLHLGKGRDGQLKYRKLTNTYEDETAVLNEVHIYIIKGNEFKAGAYTLALENIQKVETIEKDKIKTRKSYALGTSVTIVSSALLLGVVVGLMAASEGYIF